MAGFPVAGSLALQAPVAVNIPRTLPRAEVTHAADGDLECGGAPGDRRHRGDDHLIQLQPMNVNWSLPANTAPTFCLPNRCSI